jgi:uncharacterized protein YcbX
MPDWVADHPVATLDDADPRLAGIQRFPIKGLDREDRKAATLRANAALAGDRRWVIADRPADEPFDPMDAEMADFVNGKQTATIHRLRSRFASAGDGGPAVSLRRHDDEPSAAERFALWDGETGVERTVHAPLNDYLSDYFDRPVSLRRVAGGRPDRTDQGPSIVATATLRELAAWFDVTLDSARRRFRANLEVDGVPPFWCDRLFADEGEVVEFRVGDAILRGVTPCARCVTPTRDPDTGAATPDFRETFIEYRRATKPVWTDSTRFDHDFRVMVTARVPDEAAGQPIDVGDAVERLGVRPEP